MSTFNILFITFYGLIDYIEDIINTFDTIDMHIAENAKSNILNSIEISTHNFSYLHYLNNEKRTVNEIMNMINDYVGKNNITHVFWFFYPENIIDICTSMNQVHPKTKNVFYNFDDPKSFNIDLVKKSKKMDYFINPNAVNERKYMYIMDMIIHTVPLYTNDLILNYRKDIDTLSELGSQTNYNSVRSVKTGNTNKSHKSHKTNKTNRSLVSTVLSKNSNIKHKDDDIDSASDDISSSSSLISESDNMSNIGSVYSIIESIRSRSTINTFDNNINNNRSLVNGSIGSIGLSNNNTNRIRSIDNRIIMQRPVVISIIVDSDYMDLDTHELNEFRKHVSVIKDILINVKYNSELLMFGPEVLEKSYPDIYENIVDPLLEGDIILNSDLVIVLDIRKGLDKSTTQLLSHCMAYNKIVLTNCNIVNVMYSNSNIILYDLLSVETILDNTLRYIASNDHMDYKTRDIGFSRLINNVDESRANSIKSVNTNDTNANNRNVKGLFSAETKILDINEWVLNILAIIS